MEVRIADGLPWVEVRLGRLHSISGDRLRAGIAQDCLGPPIQAGIHRRVEVRLRRWLPHEGRRRRLRQLVGHWLIRVRGAGGET